MGTKEIIEYYTARSGTLALFVILSSCFFFLCIHKPYGTLMWASVSTIVLCIGIWVAKKRAPEIREIVQSESEMEMILHLAESSDPNVHVFFQRPREEALIHPKANEVYITLYSPRQGIPAKVSPNHFRFPLLKMPLYDRILALLSVVQYELSDKEITIHFGWPMSSWLDRMSIGVMIYKLMRLPSLFPQLGFIISYHKQWKPPESPVIH